jgi:hypothetical protein
LQLFQNSSDDFTFSRFPQRSMYKYYTHAESKTEILWCKYKLMEIHIKMYELEYIMKYTWKSWFETYCLYFKMLKYNTGRRGFDYMVNWICILFCHKCLSPLKLWFWFWLMVRRTWYNRRGYVIKMFNDF